MDSKGHLLAKEVEHLLLKGLFRLDHLTVPRKFIGNHIQTTRNVSRLKSDVPAVALQEPP